jgi:hypothetical protein
MSRKVSVPAAPRGMTTTPVDARSNPAHAADTASLQPPRHDGVSDQEAVRTRAYSLWQQAGSPEGDGVEFWLLAEQELHTPR